MHTFRLISIIFLVCLRSSDLNISAASLDVQVINYNYRYDAGYGVLVGEIQNFGQNNVEAVNIETKLFDKTNKTLIIVYTSPLIKIILPNQKSPFEAGPFSLDPSVIGHVIVTVKEFRMTENMPYRDFIIRNLKEEVIEPYFIISGELVNIGNINATSVDIVTTYYDETGVVLGASSNYLIERSLNSGLSAPFEASTYPNTYKPQHYSLQVQCKDFKMPNSINVRIGAPELYNGTVETIFGSITPAGENEGIMLKFRAPDNSTFERILVTNANGYFSDSFNPLIVGLWKIEAVWMTDSYPGGIKSNIITVTVKERPVGIDIGALSIRVYRLAGFPIKEVKVLSIIQPAGQKQLIGYTDIDGYLSFAKIFSGKYNFHVSSVGYNSKIIEVNVSAGEPTSIVINMERLVGRVIIHTLDELSKPIIGASIYSKSQLEAGLELLGKTDKDGEIILNNLEVGDYYIEVKVEGFKIKSLNAGVKFNETSTITVTLDRLKTYNEELNLDHSYEGIWIRFGMGVLIALVIVFLIRIVD